MLLELYKVSENVCIQCGEKMIERKRDIRERGNNLR